ncbi:MAG: ABC transporter permease, partial [Halocynthiibacter sp.]
DLFFQPLDSTRQNIEIGDFVVPVQFMQALPYILTVVILAGFIGKAIPPRAGGAPYIKER